MSALWFNDSPETLIWPRIQTAFFLMMWFLLPVYTGLQPQYQNTLRIFNKEGDRSYRIGMFAKIRLLFLFKNILNGKTSVNLQNMKETVGTLIDNRKLERQNICNSFKCLSWYWHARSVFIVRLRAIFRRTDQKTG